MTTFFYLMTLGVMQLLYRQYSQLVSQVNCSWPLPAQSFLVPGPTELMTIFFCLTSHASPSMVSQVNCCWSLPAHPFFASSPKPTSTVPLPLCTYSLPWKHVLTSYCAAMDASIALVCARTHTHQFHKIMMTALIWNWKDMNALSMYVIWWQYIYKTAGIHAYTKIMRQV